MFFEKIIKIEKSLARLTTKMREKLIVVKSGRGDVTTKLTERKRMLRECYELLYAITFDNLDEMENLGKLKTTKTDSRTRASE